MKKAIFLSVFTLFFCFSCGKQEVVKSLSAEKIFIIEYNYFDNEDKHQLKFHVFGFSQLDANFNLKYAMYGHDGFYYCNSNIVISNCLRNKISEAIMSYSSDTSFISKEKYRIYDGNHYKFIICKNNGEEVKINFEPEFLSDDLLFVYNILYGDYKTSIPQYGFGGLFKEFEKLVHEE
jgi:hypothetical protein